MLNELFTLQTVQKFEEAARDALMLNVLLFMLLTYRSTLQLSWPYDYHIIPNFLIHTKIKPIENTYSYSL